VRLLFYIEHFGRTGGGAENYAAALCAAMAERGHDIHVACRTAVGAVPAVTVHPDLDDPQGCASAVEPDLTVDWGLFARADLHRLGGSVHRQFLHLSRDAYPRWQRPLRDLACHGPRHQARIRAETRILQDPYAHYLAISQFVAGQARAEGLPDERITVLHNAVDTQRFRPAANDDERCALRCELGYDDSHIVFLFVAHNLRLKNFTLLEHVFARLAATHPEVRLAVLGKRAPRCRHRWLQHISTSAQPETVYRAADVLLHPTYFDTFGSVVLEAMSCGLPVVVSPRAGAAELVRTGSNGTVLPVTGARETVETAWNAALTALLAAPLRQRLGRGGRATAEQHGFTAHVEQFETLLQRLLADKQARSS